MLVVNWRCHKLEAVVTFGALVHTHRLRNHPLLWLALGTTLVYLIAVASVPRVVESLVVVDGPIEDLGHVVLLLAIAAWATLARRLGREQHPASKLVLGIVLYLVFIEMEEINWGDVYGLDLGASLVTRLVGTTTFHRAYHNAYYANLLGVIIASPIAVYFALGLFRRRAAGWLTGMTPASPLRVESILFFTVAILAQVLDAIPLLEWRMGKPTSQWGLDSPLGLFQALIYTLLCMVALRALRSHAASPGGDLQ